MGFVLSVQAGEEYAGEHAILNANTKVRDIKRAMEYLLSTARNPCVPDQWYGCEMLTRYIFMTEPGFFVLYLVILLALKSVDSNFEIRVRTSDALDEDPRRIYSLY